MLIEGAGSQTNCNQLPITTAAISHSDTASHVRAPAAKCQMCICKPDYIYTVDVHSVSVGRTRLQTFKQ